LLEQERKNDDLQQGGASMLKNVIEYDGSKAKATITTTVLVKNVNDEPDLEYNQPKTNEDKAKYLFNKGVLLEQQGRHYEAIKFYRMAMQLDADIEFKVGTSNKQKKKEANNQNEVNEIITSIDNIELNADLGGEIVEKDESQLTIFEKFQAAVMLDGRFCEKNTQQKVKQVYFEYRKHFLCAPGS